MLEHHVHVVLGEEHADRFFPRDLRGQPHQLDALARRHAGGRLVHQQKFRLVGERHRELQPLEIAIGELAAGPIGITAHADEIEQPARLVAREIRRRGPEIEQRLPYDTSATCTFSRTVMVGKVAVIWNVRPTPSRQIARGFWPTVSSPSRLMRPLSGVFWPLSISKQVLLPAPFGPISARISPALSSNDTPRTACTPP